MSAHYNCNTDSYERDAVVQVPSAQDQGLSGHPRQQEGSQSSTDLDRVTKKTMWSLATEQQHTGHFQWLPVRSP